MDEKAIHVTSWGAEVACRSFCELCMCVCGCKTVCVCVCVYAKDGAIDVK